MIARRDPRRPLTRSKLGSGRRSCPALDFLATHVAPVCEVRVRGGGAKCGACVMVLACPRRMFVRPVLTMDQRSWTASHVVAFEFFGGVPRRLVPDNLRVGVDKPDLYDPKINRSYAELDVHYGTLIDPARAVKAEGQTPC